MSMPEQRDTPVPAIREGQSKRWNPVAKWLRDRKAAQEEKQNLREALTSTIRGAFADTNERYKGQEAVNFRGEQILNGDFYIAGLGEVASTTYTRSKLAGFYGNDLRGIPFYVHRGENGEFYVSKPLDGTNTWRYGSKDFSVGTCNLQMLSTAAEQVRTMADTVVTTVDVINSTTSESARRERNFDPESKKSSFQRPAVFEGQIDGEQFSVSYGYLKNRNDIYVVQKGKVAYIVTVNADKKYLLKRVEITGNDYDPDNPKSGKEQKLAQEDIIYLSKIAAALPASEPKYWFDTYRIDLYKKWKATEQIEEEILEKQRAAEAEKKRLEEWQSSDEFKAAWAAIVSKTSDRSFGQKRDEEGKTDVSSLTIEKVIAASRTAGEHPRLSKPDHATALASLQISPELKRLFTGLPGRTSYHLYRMLGRDNSPAEVSFATAFLQNYQNCMGSATKETAENITDVLNREGIDTQMWWTFAPYLYTAILEQQVNQGSENQAGAISRLFNWAARGDVSDTEAMRNPHLPGLSQILQTRQGWFAFYYLVGGEQHITHVFTREKAKELVKRGIV